MSIRNAICVLTILASCLLFAASNPEVDEIECTPYTNETCSVTPPSVEKVDTKASCTQFTFEIKGLSPGVEKIERYVIYTGEGYCPEPKYLGEYKRNLSSIVSWKATAGGVTRSGTGARATIPRTNAACRAECEFKISCKPSTCSAPSPTSVTATAEFSSGVEMAQDSTARLCCVSTNHPSHVFRKSGCDSSRITINPSSSATIAAEDDDIAFILGVKASEKVQAIAKAACGGQATNTFDVVEIKKLTVKGLCGCLSASDATDEDSDLPTVETMDLGYNTGFEISLPVEPTNWAKDTRWILADEGWMPKEGVFSGDKNVISCVNSSGSSCIIKAWFDCNTDKKRDEDEPKRCVKGTIVKLGTLEAVGDFDRKRGENSVCDEVFSPGDTICFRNIGFSPSNRTNQLEVISKRASDKKVPMTIPLGVISPSGFNTWELKIPDDCADGVFLVELTDPKHHCTSIVKRFSVQQCVCSSCDEFAKEDSKNGSIDITFGLGRTISGGAKAPIRVVLETTDKLPALSSAVTDDGRMDVSATNDLMTVTFTRKNERNPVVVYTLIPGSDVFTLQENRDGSLRKTVRWMLNQGVWTMEVWDETYSPAMLVKRDVRTSGKSQLNDVERLVSGNHVTEIEYVEIPDYGLLPIRETRGEGLEARSTYSSYITSGISKGRIHSRVSSDGSWTLYEYDSSNRVKSVIVPFGDTPPILNDKKTVIGYNGRVRKTEYSYEPVDSRDNASTLADEARMIIEKIGSNALGWIEVSRNYSAHFVEGNIRTEISEKASSPLASYGTEGNQRTISTYLIDCQGAGRPIRRETPDGLVTLWEYEFTPSNVVTETMTVPISATNGISFKTTILRSVEDNRGDISREETYVLTEEGRELLSWVEYERDGAGHEIKRITSDGKIVERAWSCCGPEWEKDERGIITDYSYDALGRQVTTTRNGITTFRMYDLLGNVTNETRFAGSLFVSSSTGYDCAGRLAWSVGEDGARTEYVYSTSSEGGEIRTTIQAAGTDCAVTNTIISLRDGSTKATYLNGVLKTTEVHEPFASLIYEGTNGIASARWSRSESDFLGRTVVQSRPGFGGSTLVTSNYYDSVGRLVSTLSLSTQSTRSTRLNSQLYFYNELNERIATIDDRNFNEIIDWAGPDLISSNLTHYVKFNGDWWRETRQWSIHDDNSVESRLIGVQRSRITGLGVDNLASESVTINQRGNETLSRTFCNRDAAEEIVWTKYPTSTTPEVTISTNGLVYSSTSQTGVTTTFGYDALQRQIAQTDGRGNTTRTTYDNFGRVSSTIDALGYATAYGYDALGRQISVTDPLTNTVYTAYDSEGHVVSQRGATYPVDYAYDEFGDKISMTTYRDINAAGDVTRWLRDEATGLVTNKVYADDSIVTYTYTPDGLLLRETKPSGVWMENVYDAARQTVGVISSDGAQDAIMQRDRFGHVTAESNSVAQTEYSLDDFWGATNEVQTVDAISVAFKREFDAYGRLVRFARIGGEGTLFGYAPHGSACAVSNGSVAVEYAFTEDVLDAGHILAIQGCADFSREVSRHEHLRNLIVSVSNRCGNISHGLGYRYDTLQRPISRNEDTFGYNVRGEIVSATIDGQNESHSYDDIGNAVQASYPASTNDYTSNCRNQYSSIAAVSEGTQLVASVSYDLDGNMTRHGEWTYVYDSGNRLVSVASNGITVATMSYDTQGRRVKKVAADGTHRYFYDGWLLVYENVVRSNNTTNEIEYVWGKDVSGTRDGAAGIGGLLFQKRDGAIYVPWYDAYGNILGYRDAQGNVVASYTYDAFGNIINQSGTMVDSFVFRFSTKYFDADCDLYYYGYRHYKPQIMCWLTEDPIGEEGGVNQYLFCDNSGIYMVDIDGRWPWTPNWTEQTARQAVEGKIAEMRKNGYNFAADALVHFLSNAGHNIDLSQHANEISSNIFWQRSFIASVLAKLREKDPKGTGRKFTIGDIEHAANFDKPMPQSGNIGNSFAQQFDHRFYQTQSMGLFYALYGSRYSYYGTASWKQCNNSNLLVYMTTTKVSVDVKVVTWDRLTYPEGMGRTAINSYNAANYLEREHHYKKPYIFLRWNEKGKWTSTFWSTINGGGESLKKEE